MTWGRNFVALAAATCLLGEPVRAQADVTLPAIFGNHMVLEVTIAPAFWGSASPGESVTVTAAGHTGTAIADAQGRWRVTLPTLFRAWSQAPAADAQAPFEVVVQGKNRVVFTDVVAGEVWLASGQSNMEFPLYATDDAETDLASATTPKLRLFQVKKPNPESLAGAPVPLRGRWVAVTPETAARFSAVGYFFGRALADRRPRPIGIIHSSWGGSRAEPWIRRSALAPFAKARPQLRESLAALDRGPAEPAAAAYRQALQSWEAGRHRADGGDRGTSLGFARPAMPPGGWRQAQVPGSNEAAAGRPIDGALWWRREVELPSGFVGQPLFLRLGSIGQCDTTFVEGALIGATCETAIAPERFPRGYQVPATLTHRRALTIAVRVWDAGGAATPGGLLGPPDSLRLVAGRSADGPSIGLAGTWWWRVESELPASATPAATAADRPVAPPGFPAYQSPGVLWDNMIDQLVPFGLRGVIWYQGESNTKDAHAYRTLMSTLIQDWRRAFATLKLPFLLVQLAGHRPRWSGAGQRSDEEWPELREAQALVTDADPASGLAVTIDLGAHDDIHPRNKREVGRRLALVALGQVYGEPVEPSGPRYAGLTPLGDGRIRVRFSHATGLEAAAPPPVAPPAGSGAGRLVGFEIAGPDRQFVTAAAQIEGETVVLSAPGVPKPVAVRYAWGDDPSCNLINWAALPAVPFRTDRWPRFSQRQKP
jgi:sialate O-acetylesterase